MHEFKMSRFMKENVYCLTCLTCRTTCGFFSENTINTRPDIVMKVKRNHKKYSEKGK